MIFQLTQVTTERHAATAFGQSVSLDEIGAISKRLPPGTELLFEVRGPNIVIRDFPSCKPVGNILARIQEISFGPPWQPDLRIAASIEFPDDTPRYGVGYGYTPTEAFDRALADYEGKSRGELADGK